MSNRGDQHLVADQQILQGGVDGGSLVHGRGVLNEALVDQERDEAGLAEEGEIRFSV